MPPACVLFVRIDARCCTLNAPPSVVIKLHIKQAAQLQPNRTNLQGVTTSGPKAPSWVNITTVWLCTFTDSPFSHMTFHERVCALCKAQQTNGRGWQQTFAEKKKQTRTWTFYVKKKILCMETRENTVHTNNKSGNYMNIYNVEALSAVWPSCVCVLPASMGI